MRARTGIDPCRASADLLRWFVGRTRDIPWRETRDPYAVWVAEIMAQQTRIVTMRGYFARFMERWPDVDSLARAPLDDVLKAWEGLGYYSRARNLHRAAREVVSRHGGRVPDEASELRQLPGIGPYTAGAIASIAYGRAEPAVDGNARRVLCRLFDVALPTPAVIDSLARSLVECNPDEAGALNQALMDLGSQLCASRSPRCGQCPLSDVCQAGIQGTIEQRPPRPHRAPRPHRELAVAVAQRAGRLLVRRRPETGLLGGLWEFPSFELKDALEPSAVVQRGLEAEHGVAVRIGAPLVIVNHDFTHFSVTMHAIQAEALADTAGDAAGALWVRPEDLAVLAFSSANRRIIDAL